MTLRLLYLLTTLALLPAGLALTWALRRRGRLTGFSLRDLTTLALVICLLYVAVLPFRGGLAKIPGLDALVYSIPYTVVLLLGLHLVPKPGAATAVIGGQALLGQLLGGGPNPAYWPYHLWCALVVECFALLPGRRWLALAVARGVVSYAYYYALLGPLFWHKYYAPWFIALKMGLGAVGCAIGAVLASRLPARVEAAAGNPLG